MSNSTTTHLDSCTSSEPPTREELLLRIAALEEERDMLRASAEDADRRRRRAVQDSEVRLAAQSDALEMALGGAPLAGSLDRLARLAAQLTVEDARAAIFLSDETGSRLRLAANAGLPAGFVSGIDGLEISPSNPSCASAAATGESVIVRDIRSDEKWAPYLSLAEQHGIRSCWSVPIRVGNEIAGTIVAYHASPRSPEARELEALGMLGQTAALILERERDAEVRERAETALSGTLDRLRSVLENSLDAAYRRDLLTDSYDYLSHASRHVLGFDPDRLQALSVAELLDRIHPEDRTIVEAAIRQGTEVGRGRVEYRFRDESGEYRWVADHFTVQKDRAGVPIYRTGTVRDVTEQKRTEERLRRNHETFFNLVQNAPLGVYVVDAEFRLRQVSAGSQKVFRGVRPLLGRDFAEVLRIVWSEPFATEAINRFRHTLATGEPYWAPDTTERRGDIAEVESYDWKIERVTLPDGQFGVVCYFYDLTERLQAEEAIRDSERASRSLAESLATERGKLAAIIENLPVGIGTGDLEGNTISLNPAGLALFGFASEDEMYTARGDYERELRLSYLDGREMPIEEWPMSRARRRDYVRGLELCLRDRSGTERIVCYDVVPVRGEDGAARLLVYVMQDLTDRKRNEANLREAKRVAEAASRAKSQFLAVMSHELRTPLAGIIGFTDLLETEVLGTLQPRQQEALARIKASSWHLVGIIDEILTHSRAEAGKEEVRWEEVDVAEITREVVRSIEPQAHALGLDLGWEDADSPAIVSTDPGKVRQILINLVGNAVKYTGEGRIRVHVDRSDLAVLRVHVRDTGPGISPDDQERVFEPFTQVDSSHTRGGGGTGLGLAICRRFARLLGGDVLLESVPGKGSCFTLELSTLQGPGTRIQ